MPTIRQKRLAKAIIEDSKSTLPKSGGELLKSVGYSEATAIGHTSEILEAEGVKEALDDLGFSEDAAKKVVSEILHKEGAKDHDRLDAADKVFKVHGSYAPEKNLNVNVDLAPSEEIKALTQKLNELYRGTSGSSDGRESGALDNQAPDKE